LIAERPEHTSDPNCVINCFQNLTISGQIGFLVFIVQQLAPAACRRLASGIKRNIEHTNGNIGCNVKTPPCTNLLAIHTP